MLAGLMAASRLSAPDRVVAMLAEHATALGVDRLTVYLVEPEQYELVPVPVPDAEQRTPLSIEATIAGRCFRILEQQEAAEGREVWVPLLDGLERLGVLHLEFPSVEARVADELLHRFAALAAEIVMVKNTYGDLFTVTRRRQQMSLAGEIAWNLMPPLTFGTQEVVVSCMLAPAYSVGGDSFDYAVDGRTARLAIFDAMGHGLKAGLMATVAVAAYRRARRSGRSLTETVAAVDADLAGTLDGDQFVTGLLLELDLVDGTLVWYSAVHPPPLLLRGTRVVKTLVAEPGLPLGVAAGLGGIGVVGRESLEPGDRVLMYSDGVVEARSGDGTFFGVDHLGDLVSREAAAEQPAPETMRRLMHAILDHQSGELQDDATTVLIEWKAAGQERVLPDFAPHRDSS
jgi:hypothetical protein